ncbi:MAG: CpeR family transcriptional regulator [Aphanocapsa feldmannii 288cV]|nr:MAG: CpeR family transcriptional regulator [Aphanocapsa feldmannii 288cV]
MDTRLSPSQATAKLKGWMRSRHLICCGHFFVMESVDQSLIDRFCNCIEILGGTLITVEASGRWAMGPGRHVVVLRARATLLGRSSELITYWAERGGRHTRFEESG